jgi:patatin-related protein
MDATAIDATDATDPTAEEVRFAVVLNGGVSLAVWMGGVVLELDRITRSSDGYRHLCGLVGASARADVISGTSAGGINGAALALAQVNPRADLNVLRDLWSEQGRMDLLLRTPFKGAPVSLLKGDEFFLPRLQDAMRRLTARYEPLDVDSRPIDLRITTTLLQGQTKTTMDSLGQRLTQSVHQGSFRFRHDHEVDHFSVPNGDLPGRLPPQLPLQLALAARSSASFPVAFEPSFVPVDGTRPGSLMNGIASWGEEGIDRSRFAVDGGVLVNTPTREALEAIDQMPAEGPTRRVMLLVFPHAAASPDVVAQTSDDQPSVMGAVSAIMRAQSSQSNRTFVDEIERYNRGAAARRGGRGALLESLSHSGGRLPHRLYRLVETLYPHYVDIRIRRAARKLAERQVIARAVSRRDQDANSEAWSFERIRDAVESAHRDWYDSKESLPYVPPMAPPAGVADPGKPGWPWDITTAERLAASALDLLKRLVWILPKDGPIESVRQARRSVHQARSELRKRRAAMHKAWEQQPVVTPDRPVWQQRLIDYNERMTGPLGEEVLALVKDVAKAFAAGARALLDDQAPSFDRDQSLISWLLFVWLDDSDPDAGLPDESRWLSRLLALEVATTCLADDSESPEEQLVELAQISLQTQNAFAEYSVTPDDKAGGYSLSRFSGFLKRSWRANDWIWGRLDAASMLCRIMLDPARVRRTVDLDGRLARTGSKKLAEEVLDDLVGELFGQLPGNPRIALCRQRAVEELTMAFNATPGDPLPATCPYLAELVAWALHIRIMLDELPELRRAICADGVDGANARSRGEHFVKQYAKLLDEIEELPAGAPIDQQTTDLGLKALAAFDRAGVGREPLSEEVASDQMIRTVATAAATAVTVADSDRLGVKAARPLTRSLRGLTLLPYWTILGLTRGGRLARFLGQFGLAAGGLLLVLAMLGALPEWASAPGAAIGGGALLAAFAYSALRTGSLLHGLVMLSPVATLVTYGVTSAAPNTVQTTHGLAGLIGVALFVTGLLLLGSLPGTTLTPMGTAEKAIRGFPRWLRRRRWVGPLAGIAAAGAGILVGVSGVFSFLDGNRPLLMIGLGAVVLLAAVLSYVGGKSLRTWHLVPGEGWTDPPTRDRAAAAAGWAVVYGTCYVLIAIGLSWTAPGTPLAAGWWTAAPWWARAAMATAITFAAVLLLIVPWYVPWRARATMHRRLLDDASHTLYSGQSIEAVLCERLEAHGLLCRGLTKRPTTNHIHLTRAGKRLAGRIRKKLS